MDFKQRAKEIVAQMTLEEKAGQLRYDAIPVERLGIPDLQLVERSPCTAPRATAPRPVFPQAIAMAASFNTRSRVDAQSRDRDIGRDTR